MSIIRLSCAAVVIMFVGLESFGGQCNNGLIAAKFALPNLDLDELAISSQVRVDLKHDPKVFKKYTDPATVYDFLSNLEVNYGFSVQAEGHLGLYALAAELEAAGPANSSDKDLFYFFGLIWAKFGPAIDHSVYAENLGKGLFLSHQFSFTPFFERFNRDLKALGVEMSEKTRSNFEASVLKNRGSESKVDVEGFMGGIPKARAVDEQAVGLLAKKSGLNIGLEFLRDTVDLAYKIRSDDLWAAAKPRTQEETAKKYQGSVWVRGRNRSYKSREEAINLLRESLDG
jgi:hypothetical protein